MPVGKESGESGRVPRAPLRIRHSPSVVHITYLACWVAALLHCATQASAQQVLAGHVPLAVASSRALNRLPQTIGLNLAIGLPLRHQDELDTLLTQLSDPASPRFKQYLTPAQFAAEFGPSPEDYGAVIQFARENGLAVTATHPNRMVLDVSGKVSDIERMLHLQMNAYEHPVRGTFYAPDREPSVELEGKLLDISGLDNFVLPHPMSLHPLPLEQARSYVTGSGPGGLFIGKDFRAAYAPGVSLTGSGQTIGLLEFDGFYPGDVQKNAAQAGLPAAPTQTVLLDGFSGMPGSSNIEVILDIMMAYYMAPGLSKVLVYEGYSPNDLLNRMATDNLAQQLSSSWGYGPINATTEQIFKEFIVQGQSMMQASGDSGAYKNGVMAPSDDPSLTVVGGTSLTTAGAGGPWQAEKAWSGSGGGVSTLYAIPAWQQGLSMAANGGSTTMRNIPDVALTADIQMFLIQSNGQAVVVGGTSAAAPLWAGFVALAGQQAAASGKPRVGFLNPLLYQIGEHNTYAMDLNDIRTGSNNGFAAVSGYDLTTGWGSPAGQLLMNDLTNTSGVPSFTLSAAPPALTVNQAGLSRTSITVNTINDFNSSVRLTISGLPTGVTASFSPASTSSASSLTFQASSTAATGTSTVTVTGVSGRLGSRATLILTVLAAAASPVNLAPAYNVTAMVADGVPFTGGGLDWRANGAGTAYSANLIGLQQTIRGTLFAFGPANLPDAVSGRSILLPAGKWAAIHLLATAVNGRQPGQTFRVTYSDGTSSIFTQGVSDWFLPQNYAGETKALITPYRNTEQGQRDNRTFCLYEYTFALNPTKSVTSIALPNNRNVVVLAATLSR